MPLAPVRRTRMGSDAPSSVSAVQPFSSAMAVRLAGSNRSMSAAPGSAEAVPQVIVAPAADADDCVEADAETRLVVDGVGPIEHRPLAIIPCAPRPGRTPERIPTNPVTVRAAIPVTP